MRKLVIAIAAAFAIAAAAHPAPTEAAGEQVMLYKNPQCGCCEAYADYLRENGFTVAVEPTHELVPMSHRAGIAAGYEGCHLAHIDGYVVSGHVPVATIRKLLSERPDIKGVTLPGMPMGSPGMAGTKTEPFTIYAVGGDHPEIYAEE